MIIDPGVVLKLNEVQKTDVQILVEVGASYVEVR